MSAQGVTGNTLTSSIEVNLFGGNGTAKSATGVNVGISQFFAAENNNGPVPLTVGQNLAWNTWHSVTLTLDQTADRYVSITVDGQTQNLSAYQPRGDFDGTQWFRGQTIDRVAAQVVASTLNGTATDDDVYWDNLTLAVPEPGTVSLALSGLLPLAGVAVRRRRQRKP